MRFSFPYRLAALCGVSLTLSACMLNTAPPDFAGGIDYREARYQEISALRDYRGCRDQALNLDQEARAQKESAKYLASARMLESCEAQLGSAAQGLAQTERMQAYALSIQNHLKGGDVAAARRNLEKFSQTFEGQDLFFADGSSFIQTMEVLLGLKSPSALGRYSDTNVNKDLKAELRRVHYWAQH